MPTSRAELLDIAKQAIAEGDEATANAAMDAAEKMPAEGSGILNSINSAIINNPIGATIAEGAAAVNRGATQLADMVTTQPANAVLELAGSDMRIPSITKSLSSATGGGFMEVGMPRDIVRAAGEVVPGAVAGGMLFRSAAQQLPAVTGAAESIGKTLLRGMGTGTAEADAAYGALSGVGQAVGKEVGGEDGALIGSVAAPAVPALASAAGGSLLRKLFGGQSSARVIDDFAAFGVVPTVGMASGKTGIQGAENISASAIGGKPLANKSELIATNMQKRLAQIADDISTKEGAETAGIAIQKGIGGRGGFVDRFRSTSSVLWNKSDSLINTNLPVDLTNTKTKLGELVRGGNIGSILDNPKLTQIKSVLDQTNQVDFDTVKALRSSIGAKIGSNDLMSDIPRAELKQIYGALSSDIKKVAAQSSGDALKAFERANNYTRSGHDRIDDYLQRVTNKVNPDEVFRAIAKGGEGTKNINAIKKSLKPDEWEVVTSNVVRRLGRANSGQQNAVGENALGDGFSVEKFVTDWDKLGSARKAIFSGSAKIDSYGDDLAKIARAASVVKEAGKSNRNASGTAQAASRIAAGTGLATGLVTSNPTILIATAASVAMNNSGARLMANPNFVKWLAKTSSIPASRSSAAVAQLVGIANQSSVDDAAAIQSLAEELENK